MSRFAYDAAAPSFDAYRSLPLGVAAAVRAALLEAAGSPQPCVLDLGAGTGRIGRAFVAAGDDYIGVDLSSGMLHQFVQQAGQEYSSPVLICADGERLPFADASFDAVMMMQVLGAARNWRPLVNETLRVLRKPGTLVIGHTVMPTNGLDARMKQRLSALLADMSATPYHRDPRGDVIGWLNSVAAGSSCIVAAEWETSRTPAGFLARQPSGARFARLPQPIKDAALGKLAAWAATTFGSLDAEFHERHAFELNVFKFEQQVER